MKRKSFIFTTFFLVVLNSLNPGHIQNDNLTRKGDLRVLALKGTPYKRGFEHGKALKKEIQELVKLWKNDIEKSYKTDADAFITAFLENTDFPSAVSRWTPDLLEEVKGIAEGAGIDFPTMFAFQLVDEMWVLGKDIQSEKCTTIGAEKTSAHPAVVAQNLDIPTFYHGFQTLVRIKDPKRDTETMVFTFPGFIAANGINSHSVAVVVNAVQQLESSRDGLPVAFVIRGILQRATFEEAVKFINAVKHGAPQNYMIGGAENVGSFECATTNVSLFIPFDKADITYHTNHPLKNMNYSPRFLQYLKSQNISPQDYEHPCPRFRALQAQLKDNSARVDVEALKGIFSNRETIINNRGTFGCTIMLLGCNPELHISAGRPDEEPFQVFQFDKN